MINGFLTRHQTPASIPSVYEKASVNTEIIITSSLILLVACYAFLYVLPCVSSNCFLTVVIIVVPLFPLACSCYILILKFEEQSTIIRRRNNFVMAKYNEMNHLVESSANSQRVTRSQAPLEIEDLK
ncbi:hypothetical protein P8452_57331 [Trifolium repens]|nr:hypothetical protein P8452_57331 [Trifolium repens]